jgi:hypothetical protein
MANDSAGGQALSHESLGVVHEVLGNKAAAVADYTEAQSLYQSFGDTESAKRTNSAVTRLK